MKMSAEKPWYKQWWAIAIFVFLGICVAFTLGFSFLIAKYFVSVKNEFAADESIAALHAIDRALVETLDDPRIGNQDAKVTIVEFADFNCDFCKEEFFTLSKLLKEYNKDVLLIFRDFPVDELNPNATRASLAANCALDQNKYWQYHDKLFLNKQPITDDLLTGIASDLGMNTKIFESCLVKEKYKEEIAGDLLDGLKAGVDATPTFFVNGYKVSGVIPLQAWEKLLNSIYEREQNSK